MSNQPLYPIGECFYRFGDDPRFKYYHRCDAIVAVRSEVRPSSNRRGILVGPIVSNTISYREEKELLSNIEYINTVRMPVQFFIAATYVDLYITKDHMFSDDEIFKLLQFSITKEINNFHNNKSGAHKPKLDTLIALKDMLARYAEAPTSAAAQLCLLYIILKTLDDWKTHAITYSGDMNLHIDDVMDPDSDVYSKFIQPVFDRITISEIFSRFSEDAIPYYNTWGPVNVWRDRADNDTMIYRPVFKDRVEDYPQLIAHLRKLEEVSDLLELNTLAFNCVNAVVAKYRVREASAVFMLACRSYMLDRQEEDVPSIYRNINDALNSFVKSNDFNAAEIYCLYIILRINELYMKEKKE